MTWTQEQDDRLHEAAKGLQKADPELSFSEALKIAAKAEDARRNGHGQNGFTEQDETEAWQTRLDQRHNDIQALADRENIPFTQAAEMYARQTEPESENGFTRRTQMTADKLAEYEKLNQAKIEAARRDSEIAVPPDKCEDRSSFYGWKFAGLNRHGRRVHALAR